ncbi:MAG: adenylate/guanylate cyclase domain-containing protein [Bacteroidota bacterium]
MRRIITWALAFALSISTVWAQYNTAEEVESALKQARKDQDKLKIYVQGAEDLKGSNPQKSIEYSNKAIELSQKVSKVFKLRGFARALGADAYTTKALVLMNQEKNKEAEPLIATAIKVRKGLNKKSQDVKIARNYRLLGFCIEKQRQPLRAYKAYLPGINYANKSGNREEIARSYYSLGKIQIKRKEYKEALISLGKAEGNAKQANLRQLILEIRSAYDSAKDLLERSNELENLQAKNQVVQQQYDQEIEEAEAAISSYQDSLTTAVATNEILLQESEFQKMLVDQQKLQLKAQEDSIQAANIKVELAESERQAAEQKSQKLQVVFLASILVGVLLLWMVITLFQRSLERKRSAHRLEEEKEKSDRLLRNILPDAIANDLKENGKVAPQEHPHVSILFTDFQGFTSIAAEVAPGELIKQLEYAFEHFDAIATRYRLEKIKTIGDAYMAVGGLVRKDPYHGINAVAAGMEMQDFMRKWNHEQRSKGQPEWKLRVGIHTGKVVAGVIGKKKIAYDIWGDAVNIASRIEAAGAAGKVNISEATFEEVKQFVQVEPQRTVEVKNRGEQNMFFVQRIIGERVAKQR